MLAEELPRQYNTFECRLGAFFVRHVQDTYYHLKSWLQGIPEYDSGV
ncbi:unnamed protein product, partial [marine sediment metagenome]